MRMEVVARAAATSIRDTAREYKIEESTIRAWVKKMKTGDGNWLPSKKSYIQQKYTEQVLK